MGDEVKKKKKAVTTTAGWGIQINCMEEFFNFKDDNIEKKEYLYYLL